ncbi:hypothetical protein C8A01DRAFT_49883 [Parachaetomium inaequale]|uniref:Uncharacterized protein n=1 Tax=Parachaetomium inaequale TaxID=2588326 RepID=A0AAN6PA24_9PEZI|nr:hypothetical protein C8A01DRAFT_49883 [Parachaetomium inaequale]
MSAPESVQQFHRLLGSSSFLFLLFVAATAEAAEHLEKVRSWTGFSETVIVDPENLLARELKSRKLLDVAITDSQLYRLRGYKHGMAQPALLVVKSDGAMNIGGATDRPVLAEVWKNTQNQLQGGDVITKQGYATTGVLHLLGQKLSGW